MLERTAATPAWSNLRQRRAGEGALEKAPDAFRTISEVAEEISVPQHVLRFWESRFTQIRPLKRGGGRRYYRPDDVDLLRGVRHLLYSEGYTIRGVQRILREEGLSFVQSVWRTGAKELPAVEFPDEHASAEELEGEADAEGVSEDEDEADDDAEPETPNRRREPSFFTEPSTTAARSEARPEPRLAPQPNLDPAAAAPTTRHSADSDRSRQRLQAALDELVACRGLIQAVLADTPWPQERPDEAS
jgi:DNA-binding transcriptional MerR regulator